MALPSRSVPRQEGRGDLRELLGRLDLRPVAAVGEHVQLGLRDQLERHHGAVERVDPVLAAPGEQRVLAQAVRLAPEHAVLGGLGVPEAHAHRAHRLLGAGGGGVGEPLLDQLVGDQRLVDDHGRDERTQRLASRVGAEVHQPLHALGGVGVEQVEATARPGPSAPAGRPGRGGSAPGASPCRRPGCCRAGAPLDAELVEQLHDVVGASAGSSCRRPLACRSRRTRAGRPAGCGRSPRSAGSAGPKLDQALAPGPPPCSITSGRPPPTSARARRPRSS